MSDQSEASSEPDGDLALAATLIPPTDSAAPVADPSAAAPSAHDASAADSAHEPSPDETASIIAVSPTPTEYDSSPSPRRAGRRRGAQQPLPPAGASRPLVDSSRLRQAHARARLNASAAGSVRASAASPVLSIDADVLTPLSGGSRLAARASPISSPFSANSSPSSLSSPSRTPRERRYIVSPLNQLLTEETAPASAIISAIPENGGGDSLPLHPLSLPPSSSPSGLDRTGDDIEWAGTDSVPRSRGSSHASGPLLGPGAAAAGDYTLRLDPLDPVAVRLRDRRARRASVIQAGKTSIAFVPTEADNNTPQTMRRALPSACGGSAGLEMPSYITGPMSSVVLPSRLAVLGRREFKPLSVFDLHHVGNSLLGYAPVWTKLSNLWRTGHRLIKPQLFYLPAVFTRATAIVVPFLKLLFAVIVVVCVMAFFGVGFSIGYYWMAGLVLSLWVQLQLSRHKRYPDGVMSFCRSLGAPAIEEYMFSYCFAPDTKLLRANGEAARADQVHVGDQLVGPDGRAVLVTATDWGYEVDSTSGTTRARRDRPARAMYRLRVQTDFVDDADEEEDALFPPLVVTDNHIVELISHRRPRVEPRAPHRVWSWAFDEVTGWPVWCAGDANAGRADAEATLAVLLREWRGTRWAPTASVFHAWSHASSTTPSERRAWRLYHPSAISMHDPLRPRTTHVVFARAGSANLAKRIDAAIGCGTTSNYTPTRTSDSDDTRELDLLVAYCIGAWLADPLGMEAILSSTAALADDPRDNAPTRRLRHTANLMRARTRKNAPSTGETRWWHLLLKDLDLCVPGGSRIPVALLTETDDVRRWMLAGFLDASKSDARLLDDGCTVRVAVCKRGRCLLPFARDLVHLSRGLGLCVARRRHALSSAARPCIEIDLAGAPIFGCIGHLPVARTDLRVRRATPPARWSFAASVERLPSTHAYCGVTVSGGRLLTDSFVVVHNCWKLQAENVRTLAKAMWSTNVGVWIDVVKLTPGDEIRPMLRTVAARVYRVVIFMCPEYIASPNCCIELAEAVQRPEKLLFCVLEHTREALDPEIWNFMRALTREGAQIVTGFPALFRQLDLEVNDANNLDYFRWWQTQDISGAGVPEEVVPTAEWPIPRFSLRGRWFLPEKTVAVGPVFLAGDCSDAGLCVAIPWLVVCLLLACAICFWNIIDAWVEDPSRAIVDYLLIVCIFGINIAPLMIGGHDLLDTRRYIDATLRPLLASRAIGGGVLVEILGAEDDFIVQILKRFLSLIGHLKPSPQELEDMWHEEMIRNRVYDRQRHLNFETGGMDAEHERRVKFLEEHERLRSTDRVLQVVVMDTLESRLQYFGDDSTKSNSAAIYVWSGPGDPFTKDEVGERLMRFMVLVAAWERQNLSEAIFTAIGVRVVDLVHTTKQQ